MADDDTQMDYETVSKMAERLGLEGKEKSSYVHEHMTGLGYDATPTYVKRDKEDDDKDKGRYRVRRSEGSKDKGGDSWYG